MFNRVLGNVCFNQSVVVKNYEYFSNYCCNGLCRIEVGGKQAELIDYFPGENMDELNLFSGVHYYNDKLIFIPSKAESIYVYGMIEKTFTKIELESKYKLNKYYKGNHKFESSFLINKIIYMFGCTFPGIVKLDLETMKLSYIDICFEGDFSNGFFYKVAKRGDVIWCPCMSFPVVMKYDTSDDSANTIVVETSNSGFSNIELFDENAYITGRGIDSHAIVKLNVITNECKDIVIPETCNCINLLGEIVRAEDQLFFFSEAGEHVYRLCPNDKLSICNTLDPVLSDENTFIIGSKLNGSAIEFFTTKDQQYYTYEFRSEKVIAKTVELVANSEIICKNLLEEVKNQGIIIEGGYLLKDFISAV